MKKIEPVICTGSCFISMALREDGTVLAWGDGGLGIRMKNGKGTNASKSIPVRVCDLEGITAISTRMALKEDGTVWRWGVNKHGQCGDGARTYRYTPVQVKNISGVTAISAGSGVATALKEDGTVWAWGANSEGQLGNGTSTPDYIPGTTPPRYPPNTVPTQVKNLDSIAAISAGTQQKL